jgi:hypothetical protein
MNLSPIQWVFRAIPVAILACLLVAVAVMARTDLRRWRRRRGGSLQSLGDDPVSGQNSWRQGCPTVLVWVRDKGSGQFSSQTAWMNLTDADKEHRARRAVAAALVDLCGERYELKEVLELVEAEWRHCLDEHHTRNGDA